MMNFVRLFFALLVTLLLEVQCEELTNVEKKIKADDDLSQFFVLLERSRLAKVSLQYKQVTIFAPINTAFQKYIKEVDDPDEIIPYHITNTPKKTDQFGTSYTSLSTEQVGSPVLWVTHITGTYHDDIFINNARILISQSNMVVNQNNNEQIIHKIDEVLVPTASHKSSPVKVYNPTAWEFLENYESLIIDPYRLRAFRQRVQATNKEDIFKTEGGHTFFIPVDEGFKGDRASQIDGKVIDGHVIPRQVLFTAPTRKDVPFQTLADNNVRVVISFTEEKRGSNTIVNYVKSHTILGDGKHIQGVVLAEIVKANIPVKNGVVHLIQKPLMIVDSNLKELLLENQLGILNKFVSSVNLSGSVGEEFFKRLEGEGQYTLFAPCNNAFEKDFALNKLIGDPIKFKDILDLHLVHNDKLYVDKIIKMNQNKIYQAPTLNARQNLYFNVMNLAHNRSVTVEGGGVNATVLQADLAATNGIVHVIDRVLGVPYSTVLDKLESDPMLNLTYYLGSLRGFNKRLGDASKRYTYFVPRDKAWWTANTSMPSTIKVLFMPDYSYHATNILEHHLVVDDAPYTMERIKQLAEGRTGYGFQREVSLRTVRGGSLNIYVEQVTDNSYQIRWKGETIRVFRHDVECTNGIIHVIDYPFLQESDVRISGSSMYSFGQTLLAVLTILQFFI